MKFENNDLYLLLTADDINQIYKNVTKSDIYNCWNYKFNEPRFRIYKDGMYSRINVQKAIWVFGNKDRFKQNKNITVGLLCNNFKCCNPDHFGITVRGARGIYNANYLQVRELKKMLSISVESDLFTEMDEQRFWDKVVLPDDLENKDICWLWNGAKTNNYGSFRIFGQTQLASKLAYMFFNNDIAITYKEVVCHSCDNPPCCSPHHLRKDTPAENILDQYRHGARKDHMELMRIKAEHCGLCGNRYPDLEERRCYTCTKKNYENIKNMFKEMKKDRVGGYNETHTHCKNGHPLIEENRFKQSTGKGRPPRIRCKICKIAADRDYYERKKLGLVKPMIKKENREKISYGGGNKGSKFEECCKNGHPWKRETTIWRNRNNSPVATKYCKICEQENARRKNKKELHQYKIALQTLLARVEEKELANELQ